MRTVYPLRNGRALIPVFFHTPKGYLKELIEIDSGSTITVLPSSMLGYINASPPVGYVTLVGALGETEEAEVRRVPITVEGVDIQINAAFSRKVSSKLLSVTDLTEAGLSTTFSDSMVEIINTGTPCAICR